jgi:hypothetical protein
LKVESARAKKNCAGGGCGVVTAAENGRAGAVRTDKMTWQVLPAGFGAEPGQLAGPNRKPDGVLAGPRG